MSHGRERKGKNCLNCNAIVAGRFCQICGQENLEPDENFWQLCTHFIYDIFHFDGQFFSTLKYLLFRPGFLTKEFFKGKRASYLHPIRMYLFTSALFFLIYFSFKNSREESPPQNLLVKQRTEVLYQTMEALKDSLNKTNDESKKQKIKQQINAIDSAIHFITPAENSEINRKVKDTVDLGPLKLNIKDSTKPQVKNSLFNDNYSTIEEYDSIQAALPEKDKNGWFSKYLNKKNIAINEKYQSDMTGFWEKLKENFFHSLPKMMFVSLPLAALILQLLYFRKKQFKYSYHSIFTVHVYIAVFILILITYATEGFFSLTHWRIFHWLTTIINISILFYIYKALRNYYENSRAKTILKYFLIMFLYSIVLALLIGIFFINSIIGM